VPASSKTARRVRIVGVAGALGVALASCATTPSPEAAEIAALRARVAALNAEAQLLEDVEAVKRLQRAYAFYIDKGYWDEAADLFDEDGALEVGVDGVYVGQDRVRAAIIAYGGGEPGPGLPFGQYNHHMQLQPVVHVSEDGLTAEARWREIAMTGQFQESAYWGDAVLENRYVKDDGVWKIASMRVFTNFVAPYEGGWASLNPTAADAWVSEAARALPADRPPTESYAPFPSLYTPPFHYGPTETAPGVVADSAPAAAPSSPVVAELARLVDDYDRRLDRLRSASEIENLQGMWGYYVDKGMWSEAASLFTEEGTYEFGQGGVYVGRDRAEAALGLMGPEGLEQGQLNNYPQLQPIITVSDDNRTAKARWRSDVQLSRDGEGRWGAGVYENEYVNEGGVWKISKLHYYVTMWADYDAGWARGAALPMDGPSQALPPDRPPTEVYGALPDVYLPPYHYVHPVTGEPHPGPGLRPEWKASP
jgi:hypothetical protein